MKPFGRRICLLFLILAFRPLHAQAPYARGTWKGPHSLQQEKGVAVRERMLPAGSVLCAVRAELPVGRESQTLTVKPHGYPAAVMTRHGCSLLCR